MMAVEVLAVMVLVMVMKPEGDEKEDNENKAGDTCSRYCHHRPKFNSRFLCHFFMPMHNF